MTDTPPQTRHDRLKRAGLVHLDCWVPKADPYWSAVLKREPAMLAKAEVIATTPGKRGRPPKGEKP